MTNQNVTHSLLLQGLPQGIAVNRLLPLDTVLQIIAPQIQLNDPERANILPVFAQWLKDREVDVTVDQAAWLWANYTTQFLRELPKRVSQWTHAIGKGERKSPLVLAAELSKVWVSMVLRPRINALAK